MPLIFTAMKSKETKFEGRNERRKEGKKGK
jgi:hypothetical protein